MLKITSLKLRFGSSEGKPNLEFTPTPVTIFVGPNNSGKSKLITEIAQQCQNGEDIPSDVVLEEICFEPYTSEEVERIIQEEIQREPDKGEATPPSGQILTGNRAFIKTHPNKYNILPSLLSPNKKLSPGRGYFAAFFLKYDTLLLTGTNRLSLLKGQEKGDLSEDPVTTFQKFFKNDKLRSLYRQKIYDSLALYPLLDLSKGNEIRFRLSRKEPPEGTERSFEEDALQFRKEAMLIDDASDGVKAYAGILSEVMAGDPRILLMDEPEAFLHPPLAQKLGTEITQLLNEKKKYLFVATHSAHFVMGCIQAGVPINIIRLTYKKDQATARLLDAERLKEMMCAPLLRSANVISALFYENVLVTEADSDRAFYQEVNERLLAEGKGRGIANALFLNAQNKQTIPKIMEPLRKIGIPVAGIYDLDVLKDGGQNETRLMEAAHIPELSYESFRVARSALHRALKEKDTYKKGGLSVLSGQEKAALEKLIKDYAEYGLFVVPNGELESWLEALEVQGHGSNWLIEIFKKMGSDPDDPAYVKPEQDDVWLFIEEIKKWFEEPFRKGLPD